MVRLTAKPRRTQATTLAALAFFGAGLASTISGCVASPGEEEQLFEETTDSAASPYVHYGTWGFTPADRLFLTELNRYRIQKGNAKNYPMCVYSEADGVPVGNMQGAVNHMTTVVNTWLANLVGRWSWTPGAVTFQVVATTEAGCAAEYGGFKPFRVSTYTGGGWGGMPMAIKVRFPGYTLDQFADGTSYRQPLLHELGHVLGLGHTLGEVPNSVMDYYDTETFSGISGDDIIGLTNIWKYLSGQAAALSCEFGYVLGANTEGPACLAAGGDLANKQLKNRAGSLCLKASSTADGGAFVSADCDDSTAQRFDLFRNPNATWRIGNKSSQMCLKVTGAADGSAVQQTYCLLGDPSQHFTLIGNEDGTFEIMSEPHRKMLQLTNGALVMSSRTGSAGQRWTVGCGPGCETSPLTWSMAGPIAGKTCVNVNEPSDPYAWGDNYLCGDVDYGMRWSSSGPITGMRCTQINEPTDPHSWNNNYLCVPPASPLKLSWRYGGAVAGKACVQVNENLDPHGWNDNYLCIDPGMKFSYAGPIAGKSCVRLNESADPHGWFDNWLCTDVDFGLRWSSSGPIGGMKCTQINEPADPYTWNDNYLCVPNGSPLNLSWSYGGPIAGKVCVNINEPADPHGWYDNYLCY